MEKLIEMFLDYKEKFMTIERFCQWYGVDEDDANTLILMGMKYRERKQYKNVLK